MEIKKKNYKSALNAVKCARTGMFNVPALVRSHPYTSSCELAGSCVFVKQSLGVFSCGPARAGQALSLTYGRCIAEFLNEDSPIHLRLLAPPTCVGFRYGRCYFNSRDFSRQNAGQSCPAEAGLLTGLGVMRHGFAYAASLTYQCKSNNTLY